jgi:hypothetical protein
VNDQSHKLFVAMRYIEMGLQGLDSVEKVHTLHGPNSSRLLVNNLKSNFRALRRFYSQIDDAQARESAKPNQSDILNASYN